MKCLQGGRVYPVAACESPAGNRKAKWAVSADALTPCVQRGEPPRCLYPRLSLTHASLSLASYAGVEQAEVEGGDPPTQPDGVEVEAEEEPAVAFASQQLKALRKHDEISSSEAAAAAPPRTKKAAYEEAEVLTAPMDPEQAAVKIQAITRGHQARVKTQFHVLTMEAQQWVR